MKVTKIADWRVAASDGRDEDAARLEGLIGESVGAGI